MYYYDEIDIIHRPLHVIDAYLAGTRALSLSLFKSLVVNVSILEVRLSKLSKAHKSDQYWLKSTSKSQ